MAVFLAGSSVGGDNPLVLFFHQEKRPAGSNGLATTLYSLAFSISKDGVEYLAGTPVDVETDVIDLAGKVYFATFTTLTTDATGEYQVTWTYKITEDSPFASSTSKFHLVDPDYPLVDGYAQVADLIGEGVPIGDEEDQVLASVAAFKLAEASRFVDRFCKRQFRPHYEEFSMDTRGKQKLLFEEPVIGLANLGYEDGDELVAMDDYVYRVYNRHIRQGMVNPDDREAPRVELAPSSSPGRPGNLPANTVRSINGSRFARFLPQQIFVDGFFGYTDPDGTIWGRTPDPIRECVLRLAIRGLAPLYDAATEGPSSATSGPIQMEKTYDQSVTYANIIFARDGMGSAYVGYVTGDPRIDQILFAYRKPVGITTIGGY